MKHVTIAGLDERREQRLKARQHQKAARLRLGIKPSQDIRKRVRSARVFFATLPHDTLIAAHEAVLKTLATKPPITP